MAYLLFTAAGFTGTTAISTATIVVTTGASTLLETTVNSVTPFAYPFFSVFGTAPGTSNTFSTAYSTMTQIYQTVDNNIFSAMGYSSQLLDRLGWNSTVSASSFIGVGFSLDPEASVINITPGKIVSHFHVVLED